MGRWGAFSQTKETHKSTFSALRLPLKSRYKDSLESLVAEIKHTVFQQLREKHTNHLLV